MGYLISYSNGKGTQNGAVLGPLDSAGNRSLPSWTLLAVLWQMCHVWITYRTSSRAVLMMDKLSRKYQKSTTWDASGSLMTGIPCLEHP